MHWPSLSRSASSTLHPTARPCAPSAPEAQPLCALAVGLIVPLKLGDGRRFKDYILPKAPRLRRPLCPLCRLSLVVAHPALGAHPRVRAVRDGGGL